MSIGLSSLTVVSCCCFFLRIVYHRLGFMVCTELLCFILHVIPCTAILQYLPTYIEIVVYIDKLFTTENFLMDF